MLPPPSKPLLSVLFNALKLLEAPAEGARPVEAERGAPSAGVARGSAFGAALPAPSWLVESGSAAELSVFAELSELCDPTWVESLPADSAAGPTQLLNRSRKKLPVQAGAGAGSAADAGICPAMKANDTVNATARSGLEILADMSLPFGFRSR